MKAYVLTGGLGTRLSAQFPDLPKAMVPVAGRPFIERQLEWLAGHGLTDVVLCAGYGAGPLLEHVGDGARFGVRARAVVEDRPRGTAGALADALEATGAGPAETVFAVNGDTWAEFQLTTMEALHQTLDADATLACYRVDEASARGAVDADEDGRLRGFREKVAIGPGWVSGGLYLLRRRALAAVGSRAMSLEEEIFPMLLAAGRPLGALRFPGRFWDMGTPEGRVAAEAALAARESSR